jgi:hypothetical protein
VVEVPLKRKYRSPNTRAKNVGFGNDDQGNKRRHKLTAAERKRIKPYDRKAHVMVMGPTGKTRMEHRNG